MKRCEEEKRNKDQRETFVPRLVSTSFCALFSGWAERPLVSFALRDPCLASQRTRNKKNKNKKIPIANEYPVIFRSGRSSNKKKKKKQGFGRARTRLKS